jgi:hypothetical protein
MVAEGRFGGFREGSLDTLPLHMLVDRVGLEPAISAVQRRPQWCQ